VSILDILRFLFHERYKILTNRTIFLIFETVVLLMQRWAFEVQNLANGHFGIKKVWH